MQKAWWRTNQKGMSLVEVLLAVALFGIIVTIVSAALLYGRTSTASATNHQQAQFLADEGLEAVRSIRDAAFTALPAGTYGLAQTGNTWTLAGTSDTTSSMFIRTITITALDANRRQIDSKVSWSQGAQGTLQVAATTQLTNWMATIIKSWANPIQTATVDMNGTNDAIKVATQGNYAYVVRNDGAPDFAIFDISGTTPTMVGSLSLAGAQTNIAVSGNYAYVTSTNDSGELYVINISNPASPSLASTYNASGAADGRGVFVVGTDVYVVRAANGGNSELIRISAVIPTLLSLSSSYSLNVAMNEVYVDGSDIYIATDSDTAEVLHVTVGLLGILSLTAGINLPGTTNATTITGNGKTLYVGQGTTFTVVNGSTNVIGNTLTLSGVINDIDLNGDDTLAFVGTANTAGEFQVVNLANALTPVLLSSYDVTGTTPLNGVSYSTTRDRVVGVGSSDTAEVVVLAPN